MTPAHRPGPGRAIRRLGRPDAAAHALDASGTYHRRWPSHPIARAGRNGKGLHRRELNDIRSTRHCAPSERRSTPAHVSRQVSVAAGTLARRQALPDGGRHRGDTIIRMNPNSFDLSLSVAACGNAPLMVLSIVALGTRGPTLLFGSPRRCCGRMHSSITRSSQPQLPSDRPR